MAKASSQGKQPHEEFPPHNRCKLPARFHSGYRHLQKERPVDEVKAAGLATDDFPQITADVFEPMDGGIELSPEEIMGRNAWNLWSAGNDRFLEPRLERQLRIGRTRGNARYPKTSCK